MPVPFFTMRESYSDLMGIFLAAAWASFVFGIEMLRMPFLNAAVVLSLSTPAGRGIALLNSPKDLSNR